MWSGKLVRWKAHGHTARPESPLLSLLFPGREHLSRPQRSYLIDVAVMGEADLGVQHKGRRNFTMGVARDTNNADALKKVSLGFLNPVSTYMLSIATYVRVLNP